MEPVKYLFLGPVGSALWTSTDDQSSQATAAVKGGDDGDGDSDAQFDAMVHYVTIVAAIVTIVSAILWSVLLYNAGGESNKMSINKNIWLLGFTMSFGPVWGLILYFVWNRK